MWLLCFLILQDGVTGVRVGGRTGVRRSPFVVIPCCCLPLCYLLLIKGEVKTDCQDGRSRSEISGESYCRNAVQPPGAAVAPSLLLPV